MQHETVTVDVGGLNQVLDRALVEAQLKKVPGIHEARVSYASGTATVTFDPTRTSLGEIEAQIRACGYHCGGEVLPFWVAFTFAAPIFLLSPMGGMAPVLKLPASWDLDVVLFVLATAERIAEQLKIGIVLAEVLPGQKAEQIKRLQHEGRKVGMVGDVAIESADVVLMKSDPLDVVRSITIAREIAALAMSGSSMLVAANAPQPTGA